MGGTSLLSGVPVDPDLLEHVLHSFSICPLASGSGKVSLLVCVRAYAEWIGIEAEPGLDAMDAADIPTISAAMSRTIALTDLIAAPPAPRSRQG